LAVSLLRHSSSVICTFSPTAGYSPVGFGGLQSVETVDASYLVRVEFAGFDALVFPVEAASVSEPAFADVSLSQPASRPTPHVATAAPDTNFDKNSRLSIDVLMVSILLTHEVLE
jgi:hypothetical protein